MSLFEHKTHGFQGKLVVIDGVAGVGKDTQFELLKSSFGPTIFTEKFPRYENLPYGPMCKEFTTGKFGDPLSIDPELSSLPFMLDRIQAKNELEQELRAGNTVLLCRYLTSNLAYQGAKYKTQEQRELFIRSQMSLEYGVHEIPREDLLIYLDAPWEVCKRYILERATQNGEGLDAQEELDSHMQNVAKLYRNIVETLPYAQRIDCYDSANDAYFPKEIIAQNVLNITRGALGFG